MEAVTYKGPYYPIANTTIGVPRPIFSFDLTTTQLIQVETYLNELRGGISNRRRA